MRIQHNISALNASNQLKVNDSNLSKNLQKLSSGYRINSAADDAAGLTISEKMRSQINSYNQAESNAEAGISLTQTADGALSTVQSILQRMNELAQESANGTYSGTDRGNLDKEFQNLSGEIDAIGQNTDFNGTKLFSAASTVINFQTGIDGTSSSQITLTLSGLNSGAIGINALNVSTAPTAQTALNSVSAAIDTVSTLRANIGAIQNKLEYTTDNIRISSENLTSAESNIRDVDMSSEIVDMTKNQILAQASTSMLTQAKSMPQSVLTLLQG